MRIRREYEGNTKTGPDPLPSRWLADALRLALLWLSPPWRLTDPSGIPGKLFWLLRRSHAPDVFIKDWFY